MSLAVAYGECMAPNRTHGPPLGSPSCNPPVQSSNFLTVGTSDSNGRAPNMKGTMRYEVTPGNPGTTEDEADVRIHSTVTDVRLKGDGLNDYTGELEGSISLRITDRWNGTGQTEPATVVDVPFTFAIPCTATDSGTVGATCSLGTTADALLAGTVVETKRTMWQIDQAEVRDGGPDGVASTQDNTPFLRQGIFVP
jgi:hypothetical protein